jgi:predicted HTH transcriptional regulator
MVIRDELLEALDTGQFDSLIGEVESAEVDFKRSPYRVAEEAEAFELGKDVSALANSPAGGVLIIGFQTRAPEESGFDTVESVHVFPREMFSRDQWLARAERLVYPSVVGLDAAFKPSQNHPERGVAVITVPAQPEESRYFLVAKEFVSADGAPGWMIGLTVRSADRNRPLGIAEIHMLISRSLHFGADVAEVKALVAELHAASLGGAAAASAPADALGERIDRAIGDLGGR